MIGFCSSPRFVEHQTGPFHPERSDRIRAIYAALRQSGFLTGPDAFPGFSLDFGPMIRAPQPLIELPFGPADVKWLRTVHTTQHVDYVRRVCELGGGTLDQGDTPVGRNSYEIALLALGAVLAGCDGVLTGKVDQAFAAVRPPGHHAEPERAMGFCLFSNIAIAARYIQQVYGIKRVAIVDIDVHHGNGTQACFDDDPSVYFISLHQHPRTCYPGTGYEWEIGTGAGRGYTMNIPFTPGATDVDYLKVIDARVIPELDEFRPEILLLSTGFDTHVDDPLADARLSEEGIELITRSLAAVASRYCGGKVISVLEGGYNLLALGRCTVRHLLALSQTQVSHP